MTSTITLYRVRHTKSRGFHVTQSFRILTQSQIEVPKGYALYGTNLDERYTHWYAETILPVIEQHMGDLIVERWATPLALDQSKSTVALTINNVLIHPDILRNTTSIYTHPVEENRIANDIYDAIQESETCPLAPLHFQEDWEIHLYNSM